MADSGMKKILVLVEGAKTDVRLMKKLLEVFKISAEYEIVSYNTNIYGLYDVMFRDNDPEDMDLLQTLKSHEPDASKRHIFDARYTDILLVFDLDMQDGRYCEEHILQMQRYFSESSDMGKLYINYPMVEAFYHMRCFPDPDYRNRIATVSELKSKQYKQRVNRETHGGDYNKYARTREDWIYIIEENLKKAYALIEKVWNTETPDLSEILERQLEEISERQTLFVLCTCIFFITDYNPVLLQSQTF